MTLSVKKDIIYLTNEYGNMILRLAFSYVKNMADAEDIVQEVLIKLFQLEKEFENENHQKAWIVRTTINMCKNKLKLFWNRKVCSIEEIANLSHNDTYSVENIILNAVLTLPQRQRGIIHLYYYEGYKTAEIAKILNKNESTIRSDLYRARQSLKTMLKEDYDFE